MKKIIIGLAYSILLGGCGGGGSSSSESSNISGKVADGYISGAKVFWDCNGNKSHDIDEIHTTTGSGGTFTISKAPKSDCLLVARVPIGAIDEDSPNNPVISSYTMVSTKGNEAFISPLSTLVSAHMALNPTTSQTDAESAVAREFGLTGNLNSDYIQFSDGDSIKRRGLARIAAAYLQNSATPANPSQSISDGYTKIKQNSALISTVDFGSNDAIENFINPLKGFFQPSASTLFQNVGVWDVRPNSKAGFTENQLAVLDTLIQKMGASGHVRDGVISFNQLTHDELVMDVASPLRSAGLVPTTGDIIQKIRALRDNEREATNEHRRKELDNKNTFFNTDIAANMTFWTQVGISSMEAVSGSISVTTGAPSLDLRKFRSYPKAKNTVKAVRQYKIGEVSKALLSGLNSVGKTLTADEASGINFLGQNDPTGTNLSDDQFSALNNMLLVMIDIAKDSIKTKNFSKAAQAFGPALTLYNLNSDCSTFPNEFSDECFSDAIALLESVSEALHLGTRVSGSLQWIRTTMDAYIAGKEYASLTNSIVTADQAKVIEMFERFEKKQQTFWLLTELSAVGLDNLFESYDPSIPCAQGETRYHGACVGPAPAITDLTFTPATANTAAKITAVFSTDMQSGYKTTGAYVLKVGKEGYWPNARTFVAEFSSVTSGGQITLVASGFKSVSGQPMAADRVYTFPGGLDGTFKVAAISETGKLFVAPSTASSCTFTASGVWDSTSAYPASATGTGPINNIPLFYTWNWRLYPGNFMSLIASNGSEGYVYIGDGATLNVASNKDIYFFANDGIGAHYDNGGELTVSYSCR